MSLCLAFQRTAAERAREPALRDEAGEVRLTWIHYAQEVERIAGGLAALGVRRGETVALMLRNRPEFNLLDAAVLHLGATPWSLYNTSSPEQIADLVARAGSSVLIAERDFLPRAHAALAPLGMRHMIDVESLDDALPPPPAGFDYERSWRAVMPDDVLTIIYTSGTTGAPKAVELTHRAMLATIASLTAVSGVPGGGRVISFLPSAHVADRLIAHYWPMVLGAEVVCVSDVARVAAALPNIRPTIWGSMPRMWEKIRSSLEADGLGDPAALTDEERAQVRAKIGLDAARWLFVGAAPVPAETIEFFLALGLPLSEVWGMSETCGLLTVNPPGSGRTGSVGPPLSGVELRIAADGEVLARAPQLMRGYRDDPARTAEAIDADGWLHTGDIGAMDAEGYVTIVDRKKEIIISSWGKNVSPATIENALKAAGPLIGQACVVGDGRPFVSALLVLDPAAAASLDPAGLDTAVQAEVEVANARLSRAEQIRRWTLLPTEWLPDSDELTPTMKLKRRPIAEKYSAQIEAHYRGRTAHEEAR